MQKNKVQNLNSYSQMEETFETVPPPVLPPCHCTSVTILAKWGGPACLPASLTVGTPGRCHDNGKDSLHMRQASCCSSRGYKERCLHGLRKNVAIEKSIKHSNDNNNTITRPILSPDQYYHQTNTITGPIVSSDQYYHQTNTITRPILSQDQ